MDRFLYVAMSGAKDNFHAQAINNHNLANANTNGFRQALADAKTVPLRGPVHDSRDYVRLEDAGIDFSFGVTRATGRELDLALQGDGFLAVQAPDGGEALTRAGNLHLDAAGLLREERGLPVLGEGGPIALPPFESMAIGRDGTITIRPVGAAPNALVAVDRLRLVNPDTERLKRGPDGLIRVGDEEEVPADANVRVVTGMLETSNVNSVAALTRMIELSREYETNIKMMSTADKITETSNRLLGIG